MMRRTIEQEDGSVLHVSGWPGGVDHADCDHTAPVMVHGFYEFCSACGVRVGVAP